MSILLNRTVIEFKEGTSCTSLARKLHELRDLLKSLPQAEVVIPELQRVNGYDYSGVDIWLNVTLSSGMVMEYRSRSCGDLLELLNYQGALSVVDWILNHVEFLQDASYTYNGIPINEVVGAIFVKMDDYNTNIIPQFTFNIYLPESIYYY